MIKATFGGDAGETVQGTVRYRERLALAPGAKLIVELRGVSLADAGARLVASQTIQDPGRVPIKFKVDYDRSSFDPRGRYSIQARIIESDGRLNFINDTAYEVITRGNPNRAEMVLTLVNPPRDLADDEDAER